MPTSNRSRGALDIALLAGAAAFAWILLEVEDLAGQSSEWDFLIYPHLGRFSGTANFFINSILPGIPFVFAAWRAIRTARLHGTAYRVAIGALVVVLGVVSFYWVAWLFWFAVAVINRGGLSGPPRSMSRASFMLRSATWIAGVAGAVTLLYWIPMKLAWRLFILVPLVEGFMVVLSYNIFAIHGVRPPGLFAQSSFYALVLFYSAYFVVFRGAWLTLLGGLGWLAIQSTSLAKKFSMKTLVVSGLASGTVVAMLYEIAFITVVSTMFKGTPYVWGWRLAPTIIAGAFGGVLVAYYSVREPRMRPLEVGAET